VDRKYQRISNVFFARTMDKTLQPVNKTGDVTAKIVIS